MVAVITTVRKNIKCRCVKIFLITTLLMFCMMYFETSSKPPQSLLDNFEYVVQIDLKQLLSNITIKTNSLDDISSQYLIYSNKCRIPNLDPWNPDVKPYLHQKVYYDCSKRPLLTYITKENNIATLNVNRSVVRRYAKAVTCCYSEITRSANAEEPDMDFRMSHCQRFKNAVRLKEDVVYVSCLDQENKEIYKNVHAFVVINARARKKLIKQSFSNDVRPFSILFIGVDTVSRLSFRRSLPNTLAFIQENEWIDFKAYNKIGENTFPNVMGILTGRNESNAFADCNPRVLGGLNKCNLVWYDYRKFSYITSYCEDEGFLSTFNYLKKGFGIKPVDYYFRPYILASEKCLNKYEIDGLTYCTGPETAGERILNLAREFTSTFFNNSYFGFFWINSVTHNSFNGASRFDRKFVEFFTSVNRSAALENTIVVFLSDHGFRFGTYVYTHSGWLEERLPFFYMSVPDSFKRKFPAQYQNLLTNAGRLTSPYDLYMTLQEILVLSGKDHTVQKSSACPKCRSLFHEMPYARSCEDAGIAQTWCSCTTYFTISSDLIFVVEAAKFILNEVHKLILNSGSDFDQCVRFKFMEVVSARISDNSFGDKNKSYLIVGFKTEPWAVFQATISINNSIKSPTFILEGDITRLDYYKAHSWCINNFILKKYCYCQDVFKLMLRLVNTAGRRIGHFFTGS